MFVFPDPDMPPQEGVNTTEDECTTTEDESFDLYGRASPTTILMEERNLLRPETDLTVRLPPLMDSKEEAHFLAVPSKEADGSGLRYAVPVTLADRHKVLLPHGLLCNPSPCKI
jgi:hypothetical protein